MWDLIQGAGVPNSLNWFIAPTEKQAEQIIWRRLLSIIPSSIIENKSEYKLYIKIKYGGYIEVKGADNEQALRGAALNRLLIDEAQDIKPHVWKSILRPMLTAKQAPCTMIGTKKPRNWFRDLWRSVHLGQMPVDYKCAYFPSTSNPLVPKEEWDKTHQEVGEEVWVREFISDPLANDAESSSIKYTEFNRKDHVVSYFDIPQDWKRYRFMDWGMAHPTACLWTALSPNNNIYIYDEILIKGQSADKVADIINSKTGSIPTKATILDSSCWRRDSDGISVAQRMKKLNPRAGFREDKARSGASMVKGFLRPVEGKPRLYVFPNCLKLMEELESLTWDSPTGDDLTDALMYGVVFLNSVISGSFSSDEKMPDGIKIEGNRRVTYNKGHVVKIEPLKMIGGFNHGSFSSLGEPI